MVQIVSGILFSPRGGSAHVARALARGLRAQGYSVTLLAGSRSDLGAHGDARNFYDEVEAVDFDPAINSEAPLKFEGPPGTAPMHPSFEDRPYAIDCAFPTLDDCDYERQVRAWSRELEQAGASDTDILHLHHLTPLNEAAERVAPDVPIVGQLHGTELLMLERIANGAPDNWTHAERWSQRMCAWAHRCDRLVAAPGGIERALRLLDVPPERLTPLPNGVDVEQFRPRTVDRGQFWKRVLVQEPQGWTPGEDAGSARYSEDEVAQLAQGPVLIYVGRFTEVKRLDLLIGAFGHAQERLSTPAGLVLVGGHPGEWEGEHPAEIAERLGVSGVFLAGWYGQADLPEFFSAADAVVMASEREQFGQVLVEGMACGLAALATRSLGPESIVEDGQTGWLVEPADEDALAGTMVEVVENADERERRGHLARLRVCERFSWTSVCEQFASVVEEVLGSPRDASSVNA